LGAGKFSPMMSIHGPFFLLRLLLWAILRWEFWTANNFQQHFFFFASEFNNLIYFWYWFPIVNVMHKLGRQLSVFQLMNSCFWFADQETSVPCWWGIQAP
jgi:hypothetical protein